VINPGAKLKSATVSHISGLAMKVQILGHKCKVDLLPIRTVADLIIATRAQGYKTVSGYPTSVVTFKYK